MARTFDPRYVLRAVSNELLREHFARRGELLDLPWTDLTERNIEPIYSAWQALPKQRETLLLLQDINNLDDERGTPALAELISTEMPEHFTDFDHVTGRADKAMWTYLHAPDLFVRAAQFARADSLATTRYWTRRAGLPAADITVNEEMINALNGELVVYYRTRQARGQHCHVSHCRRANGANFFFAYIEDYPDRRQIFDGGHLVPQPGASAFDIVLVYNRGVLETYSKGGKKVYVPLQQAFCRAVLGTEIGEDDTSTPPFNLNLLLDRAFSFTSDPVDCVLEVRVRRLRLVPHAQPKRKITLEANPDGGPSDIHDMAERYLNSQYLTPEKVNVTGVALTVTHAFGGEERSFSFDLSYPSSSTLKGLLDPHRSIGERCLKLWGIDAA